MPPPASVHHPSDWPRRARHCARALCGMSTDGAAPGQVGSNRRMSDTNLELANRKLQSAISTVSGSVASNKRPSQCSALDQAMSALLQSGHAPDRTGATEPALRSLPGPVTAPDHAQSQRGSQSGTAVTPGPGLPQPAWISCERCVGGTSSDTIAAAVAKPSRVRRLTPAYASLRGMLRRRAVAPAAEPVQPLSGPTRTSNWIDSTADAPSSGQRLSEAVRTGKLNRPTRRPSLDSTKSDASFVVDAPGTDEPSDPDNLRLQKTGHWYVLHPMSRYRVVWDYLLVALVLASALAVPLQLAFCDETSAALATPGTSLHQCPHPPLALNCLPSQPSQPSYHLWLQWQS